MSNAAHIVDERNPIERRAMEIALAFGALIRNRRKALGMRQVELALATASAAGPDRTRGRKAVLPDRTQPVGGGNTWAAADRYPFRRCTTGRPSAGLPDLPDLADEECDERPAGLF